MNAVLQALNLDNAILQLAFAAWVLWLKRQRPFGKTLTHAKRGKQSPVLGRAHLCQKRIQCYPLRLPIHQLAFSPQKIISQLRADGMACESLPRAFSQRLVAREATRHRSWASGTLTSFFAILWLWADPATR